MLPAKRAWLIDAGGLLLLAAVSVFALRTGELGVSYWIDEGISVGIADRPLTEIPGALRVDGSPPLYYFLLHAWIALTGSDSPRSTHGLSVLIATVAIPVTWILMRSLFDRRCAWIAAVIVAGVPFLTQYAQETRMYALVVLLSLVVCACFAGAFALRRGRGWTIGFAVALAALLYTHNWGWFLGAGLAVAWLTLVLQARAGARAAIVRDGLVAAGIVLVLLLPWLPTLAFQVTHTGAPWANPPGIDHLYLIPQRLLGANAAYVLLLAAGVGVVALWRRRAEDPAWRAALVWLIVFLVGLAVPWLFSQISPAWAHRYTAVMVGPLVLLVALGASRAGAIGIAALVLACLIWNTLSPALPLKSNVATVAQSVEPTLRAGDLIIATQPEQIPVVNYYLKGVKGLRYATVWGPVDDVGVTDWSDGVERLEATTPERDLVPLLDAMRPNQRVVLVQPLTSHPWRWRAPWTRLVRLRAAAWEEALEADPRFVRIALAPPLPPARTTNAVQMQTWVRADR